MGLKIIAKLSKRFKILLYLNAMIKISNVDIFLESLIGGKNLR